MLKRICNIPKTNSFFLFGPRATGKTTLLHESFSTENTHFIDLLNPEVLDPLAEQPQLLRESLLSLSPKIKTVVLDEIQRAPVLLDVVQKSFSENRFQFVLTGSSARKLKRGAANLLGGRALVRYLWPLSIIELMPQSTCGFATEDLSIICKKKLSWGGLPLIYFAENDQIRKDLLRSYILTYLNEEIVAEQIVRNLSPFRKFLVVAAQMSGKIVNFSKIANLVGSTHVTIQNYFEILEDTLIGFSITAYESSVRKRVRNKPKFYIFDVGVMRALARTIEADPVPGTSQYGELFEHLVMAEFKVLRDYYRPDWTLHYYQTAHGAEIDLVVDTGIGEPILIEFKSATKIDTVELGGTLQLMAEFAGSRKYILSQDPFPRKTADNVVMMHWIDGVREIFELTSSTENFPCL
jgi:predicted AAA+ superfamily ATPase